MLGDTGGAQLRRRKGGDDAERGKLATLVRSMDLFPKKHDVADEEDKERKQASVDGDMTDPTDSFLAMLSGNKSEDERSRWHSQNKLHSVAALVLFVLFVHELLLYLLPTHTETLRVDTEVSQEFEVHFEVSFRQVPCHLLGVDVVDVTGESTLSERDTSALRFRRRDRRGRNLGVFDPKAPTPVGGSKKALAQIRPQMGAEGCDIGGTLRLRKVKGVLQFALGQLKRDLGEHVRQFSVQDLMSFDVSHTLHQLRFGDPLPHSATASLHEKALSHMSVQGTRGRSVSGQMRYQLTLIPTTLRADDRETRGFVYSHHDLFFPSRGFGHGIRLPGVFINYDFSPFALLVEEHGVTARHFCVQLLALLGGVYSCFVLLHAVWLKSRSQTSTSTSSDAT